MSDPAALFLTRPDDWHVHVRDGEMLRRVVPATARQFARAIIMPNLVPPVATTELARQYRERILAAVPSGASFEPLMTLYLTENMSPDEVAEAKASGMVHGVKWYPAGATTHSQFGVENISRCDAVVAAMEEHDLPLLVHAETPEFDVDVFDREAVFIDRHLVPLVARFPRLRLVVEHLTTRHGVQFVRDASARVAGTITVHHLLLNRNALFAGGLRPHSFCLPVLKREEHRLALVEAATGGNPRYFLGTDSAPHRRRDKEAACGCAGVFTAHAAIELYAEVFESAGALERLDAFASFHGPDFYGLPRNTQRIRLEKHPWRVPDCLGNGDDAIVPFRAGELVKWRLVVEERSAPARVPSESTARFQCRQEPSS
ncbi:MAG: dihydroorotase [Pirellulaceae bacterium]|nr:dihydroorotase [Pirellulaceae bacterium]